MVFWLYTACLQAMHGYSVPHDFALNADAALNYAIAQIRLYASSLRDRRRCHGWTRLELFASLSSFLIRMSPDRPDHLCHDRHGLLLNHDLHVRCDRLFLLGRLRDLPWRPAGWLVGP
jgi:hypothetical protein